MSLVNNRMLEFYKYQGCGNDFVMINNMQCNFGEFTDKTVNKTICDRRFGIGADGMIIVLQHDHYDFQMDYYNSDGEIGTMCGNGARCALAFTRHLGLYTGHQNVRFLAADGPHSGCCTDESSNIYKVQMQDVAQVHMTGDRSYFLNTGSPHVVLFVDDLASVNVKEDGRKIRSLLEYQSMGGTNANFVQYKSEDTVLVRTYERGVEDETLACGTGAVAVAIASTLRYSDMSEWLQKVDPSDPNSSADKHFERTVRTSGGDLVVSFGVRKSPMTFIDISLTGPATSVFRGTFEI